MNFEQRDPWVVTRKGISHEWASSRNAVLMGGPRDEKNARSHGCSTRDPLVNRGSPRSSEFPAREVPGSWESPRDIPKRAEGQNPTPVGGEFYPTR